MLSISRLLVLALVCAAVPGSLGAQTSALRLVVSFERPAVYPGEPVIAYVSIMNASNDAVTLPEQLGPEYARIVYYVKQDDKPEVEFRPWALMENQRIVELPARQTRQEQARIFFGANGWTFASPGTYHVRAVLGRAASEPAELTVQRPASDTERAQSERITASREAGFFLLFDGGDHLSAGRDLLRDIAGTNTRFAGFASYALGASLGKRFADLQTGALRAPDPAAADALLQRSESRLPADAIYYQIQVKQRQIEMRVMQGRQQEAIRMQQDLNTLVRDKFLSRQLQDAVRAFATGAVK